jgi:transposase
MARKAPTILLRVEERKALQSIVRKSSSEQRMVLRAKIVLLASQGFRNDEIMKPLEVSKPVVIKWRGGFGQDRWKGLQAVPRPGRPRVYGPEVRIKVAAEACWSSTI